MWSNFRIQQLNSDKLFFKQYHYKLEVTLTLASYLRTKTSALTAERIQHYISTLRNINYNYGGSWHYYANYASKVGDANSTDISEIINVGTIVRAVPDLKYIVLDSSVHMFSDDEQQLYDIASRIQMKTGRLGNYAAIWSPDPSALTAIESGYEILAKDPGFSHKIVLRDKHVGTEPKHQIYNYLLSLGEQVKLSSGVNRMFSSKGSYLYGGWFRTNDPSIAIFLELMVPGIIQKIMPVHVKNK